jgi:hypothetical protein
MALMQNAKEVCEQRQSSCYRRDTSPSPFVAEPGVAAARWADPDTDEPPKPRGIASGPDVRNDLKPCWQKLC